MRLKQLVILLATLFIRSALASEFITTNTYTVTSDQTVADEQWVVANAVNAEGVFQNELFVLSGAELPLSGTYEGSLWGSSGADVALTGVCRNNVRLLGQNIRINGTIEGNLIAVAMNSIVIGTNANIKGSVRLISVNSIIMEGAVGGAADISSLKLITLDGTIQGNANLSAPEILLSSDAHCSGNLTYKSGKELIPPENVVEGNMKRIEAENPYATARIRSHATWFMAAVLVGIAFISLFPMTTAMASLLARKAPFKCLLVGFLSMGALPIFALILISISSGVGTPLGALLLASWGILFYVSRIIMALMIGTAILRSGTASAGRVLLAMITGLAIIYLFTFIPSAISVSIQIGVVWMGMGSLLLALLQKRRLIIKVPEELKHIEELRNEQHKPTEES